MAKPRIWSQLETMLHDTLTEEKDLLEELLAAGEGSHSAEQRAGWHQQLRQVRADLQKLIDDVEGA